MKTCLVVSTPEETYPCPAPDSREETRLFLHICYPLEEICMNRYEFSIPLRNRIEIFIEEILTTVLLDVTNEDRLLITPHQSLCRYCREETEALLVVHPADRIDAETTELLSAAQQKQIPILHYDPETFVTTRENLPENWITYEDRITESDVDDFFSDNE